MSTLDRVLDMLPPTYATDAPSVLRQFLDALALELDAYAEDLDRYRRTHWFEQVYRVGDLEKLAALVGVKRRSWEGLASFRQRVRAVVDARLAGSVGPGAVRTYVYEAVRGAEHGLDAILVPGLAERAVPSPGDPFGTRASPAALDAGFRPEPSRPAWRPLQLVENPPLVARSAALAARGGLVPYLHRWTDVNHGLDAAPAEATVTGRSGGLTAIPVLANLTTRQAIGYAGVLRVGQRLSYLLAPDQEAGGRVAQAFLDDVHEVTGRVFALDDFALGTPFSLPGPGEQGLPPRVPVQQRGPNAWMYLSAGLYDVPGLDVTFFQLADAELRQGAFDETRFDESLFITPVAAQVELRWLEHEPAAFTVVVPRGVVALPRSGTDAALVDEIADGLRADLDELRAAGVRSRLELQSFLERQPQRSSVTLPWVVIPPEEGPAGESVTVGVGGRFGESNFGGGRFE